MTFFVVTVVTVLGVVRKHTVIRTCESVSLTVTTLFRGLRVAFAGLFLKLLTALVFFLALAAFFRVYFLKLLERRISGHRSLELITVHRLVLEQILRKKVHFIRICLDYRAAVGICLFDDGLYFLVYLSCDSLAVILRMTVVLAEEYLFAVRAVNEETTVDGESVITSSGLRAARLVFSGRIYDETRPLRFLTDISSPMSGGQAYTITYRGIRFTGCILQKYELTDSCRDWTEVSLTLITYSEAEVIQE